MSVQSSQKTLTRTYKTVNVASAEPVTTTTTVRSVSPMSVSPVAPVAPLQYAVNGSYDTAVRYLVPVQQQQQQSYFLMQQPMMQQPMMQQMVSPVYLQTLPRLSVSSQESDLRFVQNQNQQTSAEVRPLQH